VWVTLGVHESKEKSLHTIYIYKINVMIASKVVTVSIVKPTRCTVFRVY